MDDAVLIKFQNEESEIIMYEVMYNPFRIRMSIDGETLIVVNEGDTMLFEDYRLFREDNDNSVLENKEDIVTIDNIKKDAMTPIID
jgi:spore coat polysaccharide biosynthesis predicted glycosyltransferase SpsG